MSDEARAAYGKFVGNSRSRRLSIVRSGFEAGWQAALAWERERVKETPDPMAESIRNQIERGGESHPYS